jgi:predicted nucleic acid-binding protein
MRRRILIDSNIYIGLARQGIDPTDELKDRFELVDLATCGVVEAEVVRGLRFPKRKQRIIDFFKIIQRLPTPSALWDEMSELAWQMDRKGIVLPLPDLIIAACALRSNAAVLTNDKHFHAIPNLTVIEL